MSIMKGGTPANMLVKSLESDLGKKMYGTQLPKNIAQSVYRVSPAKPSRAELS